MAISTCNATLNYKTKEGSDFTKLADIKSFPDLGAAPAAIEVTSLSDDAQKFIPGIRGAAAMEFVAVYSEKSFQDVEGLEGQPLTYQLKLGDNATFEFDGKHNVLLVGGGLNAAVDMKIVIIPCSKIEKTSTVANA